MTALASEDAIIKSSGKSTKTAPIVLSKFIYMAAEIKVLVCLTARNEGPSAEGTNMEAKNRVEF